MIGRIALLILFLWLAPVAVTAQERPAAADSSSVIELVLADGSKLVGTVVSESQASISFRTLGGILVQVDPGQVRSRRAMAGRLVNGEYRPFDPNTTRLFFTATGRPLRKGHGYFADYYIFFPFIGYGVTDRFTAAGGVTLFPGTEGQLVYVAPKFTVLDSPGKAVSVGMLAGSGTGDLIDSWGGIMYAAGTFGDPDRAITTGVGFLFGGGEVSNTPIFLIGGELRMGKGTKFLTENYIVLVDGGHAVISGGVRFFGERLAADLGFFSMPELLDEGGFPFLPFVGFAYNFGQ